MLGGSFLEVGLGVCVAVEDDAFSAAVVGGVFAVVCGEVCVILAEERLAVDDGNLERVLYSYLHVYLHRCWSFVFWIEAMVGVHSQAIWFRGELIFFRVT